MEAGWRSAPAVRHSLDLVNHKRGVHPSLLLAADNHVPGEQLIRDGSGPENDVWRQLVPICQAGQHHGQPHLLVSCSPYVDLRGTCFINSPWRRRVQVDRSLFRFANVPQWHL